MKKRLPELLPGMKMGRWTLLERQRGKRSAIHWLCICDCGNKSVVHQSNLRSGCSQSCGCLQSERTSAACRKHGEAGHGGGAGRSLEYNSWASMINRCCNPLTPAYQDYGARGITVCGRWKNSFEAFLDDMGRRPSPRYSIGRLDNNSGYGPDNCEWQTQAQQNRNTRRTKLITYNGESLVATDWAAKTGLSFDTIRDRLRRGWPVEKTLTTPSQYAKRVPA